MTVRLKTIYGHSPKGNLKKCGGEIDFKKLRCSKCGKQWNVLTFWFDPLSIRPMKVPIEVKDIKREKKWVEKVPGIGYQASALEEFLPKWPKWARILSTIIFFGLCWLSLWFIFWR